MYELTVRTRFAAAHRLTLVGHKCENLHGHNWKIEAVIQGEDQDEGGVVLDFGVVKKHLAKIMEQLDHTYLNDLEMFPTSPSSENIARYVAEKLGEAVNTETIRVTRVTAWESDDCGAAYVVS